LSDQINYLKINEIDAKRGVVLGLRTNWTQSIAAGDKEFVMETKAKLGAKAIGLFCSAEGGR
jgi:hypothetical protein